MKNSQRCPNVQIIYAKVRLPGDTEKLCIYTLSPQDDTRRTSTSDGWRRSAGWTTLWSSSPTLKKPPSTSGNSGPATQPPGPPSSFSTGTSCGPSGWPRKSGRCSPSQGTPSTRRTPSTRCTRVPCTPSSSWFRGRSCSGCTRVATSPGWTSGCSGTRRKRHRPFT